MTMHDPWLDDVARAEHDARRVAFLDAAASCEGSFLIGFTPDATHDTRDAWIVVPDAFLRVTRAPAASTK